MKIYILPIDYKYKPKTQAFRYPKGNADYGVEQQFLDWIHRHGELQAKSPEEADFHYLPVFWTRYHLNHNYGSCGQNELARDVQSALSNDAKTFTICQYDDGPMVNLGHTIQFLASRKSDVGIDIPLLRSPHRLPFWPPRKKFLATFTGRLGTHPIREEMAKALELQENFRILDADRSARFFVRSTLSSYACLSPRGYGGSSFRLFEAMQLGVVPMLIGDLDTRPFRKHIDWSTFSYFTSNPSDIPGILNSRTLDELVAMGERAKGVYDRDFRGDNWCHYVLKELEDLT